MSHLIDPIVNGFMLGMTTGPMCFTACFPLLLSVTLAEGGKTSSHATWLFLGKFIGGRFLAYLVFGLIVGLLGSRLGALSHQIGSIATILLSLILIAYGLGMPIPHFGMCRMGATHMGRPYFPLILGVLTGLNVCPPFLLALTYSLQKAVNPTFGIFFFLSFFLATTLYILPVGLAAYVNRHEMIIRLGKIASVVVGLVFFYQGVSALMIG